jgi:hypothetical protein
VGRVCSFLHSKRLRLRHVNFGRQNAVRLTWDRISGGLEGTKSFQDEDEEDDASAAVPAIGGLEERILSARVHGTVRHAAEVIARPCRQGGAK